MKYFPYKIISRNRYEPWHEISNIVVCATSNGSEQPAHMRSLIRAIASRLSTLTQNENFTLYSKVYILMIN